MAGPRSLLSQRGPFYGMIGKPNSVPPRGGGDHLSRSGIATALQQPTRSLCPNPFLAPCEAPYSGRTNLPALPPFPLTGAGGTGRCGAGRAFGSLFGLAPGGVFPAIAVTGNAVRSYRTFSPLPDPSPGDCSPNHGHRRFVLCGTFPHRANRQPPALPGVLGRRGGWLLATTVPCGVRTFLPAFPPGDRLIIPMLIISEIHRISRRLFASSPHPPSHTRPPHQASHHIPPHPPPPPTVLSPA